MMNTSGLPYPDVKRVEELRRIYTSAILACVMFLVSVVLDGPVTILSWVLLLSGFLCLTYVIFASRTLLIHSRPQDHKAEPHE